MSSLSPNDDARRMSPRKLVGQMPHYLAREYIEQKRGKGGKKSGGGGKKWGKESDSLSDNEMIAIRVLNQGKSQGGLQVVEIVGGPSQSEF